ncbi:MAG TPA: hypothetical protein VKD69_20285 [Vicinamibacterales bacterium]|nr:hypothetical protein [Vicinamibacterales bacterium]
MRTPKLTLITTTPTPAPPPLACPSCGTALAYCQTVTSGVPPPDRWDLFECGQCGGFEYRHRTRQLRAAVDVRRISRVLGAIVDES